MTVSSTDTKADLGGNGTAHSFAYGFKIFADTDLVVIIRSATGTETTKTLNTHYVVTGAGSDSGGAVLFKFNTTNPSDAHFSNTDHRPQSGERVIIKRVLTLTQGTDYVANDPFPAESHETALDRLTFITQQQQEELDRTFKVSQTNTIATAEFTADATSRANKVLSFDASGDLIASQELGVFRGTDATTTTTAYNVRDLVKSTTTAQLNNVYIALQDSPSGTLLTNTSYWALVVDAVSAASSAATATSQASTATTKAGEASTSASTAETHKNDAQTAKTAAESAKTAAETAQAAAETALDTFDDRFLGAKSSDPSVDNDGNALVDGALYFDTTNDLMKVYDLTNTVWRQLALTGTNQTNVNTVAGQISPTNNIATVAGDSSDIQTLATDLSGSDTIGTVATSITNVNTVATNIANVNTASSNIAGINSFGERYRVGSSDPTSSLDAGDLFFNTTSNQYKFYDGSAWQAVNVSGLGNIVEDTTPQLGGDLDVQTSSIVSVSDRDINITPNGNGSVVLDSIKYPQSDGTTGQFLKTDGSGQLAFQTVDTDLSNDTSPQLAGDLDVVTHGIISTTNRNIAITPNGSGAIVLDGLNWPTSDGSAGQLLKTDGAGQLSFGAGGMDWSSSPQTSSFNADAGKGYFVDTSSSAITVTLPASPSGGDRVAISDYKGNAATNNITVEPNGSNIEGNPSTFDLVLATDSLGAVFIYSDAAQGWIRFIADVASEAQLISPTYDVDVLVVAGGGGGGSGHNGGGGGGGAGGYIANSSKTLTRTTTYTVVVGAGGAGSTGSGASGTGTAGGDSSLTGETTAVGGGRGGYNNTYLASSGGSGGGGGGNAGTAGAAGTSGQGNAGAAAAGSGASASGGGGGGSGGAGQSGVGSAHGGAGTSNSITGSAVSYAGGGGGGAFSSSGGTGNGGGGNGGGGFAVGADATDGTGGGGGGGGQDRLGGDGGNGVVIISVPTINYSGTTTGSPTVTTSGSNTIMKFTASGSYTA